MFLEVKPRCEENKQYSLDLSGFVTIVNEMYDLQTEEYDNLVYGVQEFIDIIDNAADIYDKYNLLADNEINPTKITLKEYNNENLTDLIKELIKIMRPVIASNGTSCGISEYLWYNQGNKKAANGKPGRSMLIDMYKSAHYILDYVVGLNNTSTIRRNLVFKFAPVGAPAPASAPEKSASHLSPKPKAWR